MTPAGIDPFGTVHCFEPKPPVLQHARARQRALVAVTAVLVACTGVTGLARTWTVAPGGHGNGSAQAPFGRLQDALDRAQPGDVVLVKAGRFVGSVRTVRSGRMSAPVRIEAAAPGSVVLSAPGRVLTVDHSDIQVAGLVLDGQYGPDDTVRVSSQAHRFVLQRCEVRRSSRDLIDMDAPHGVLIDNCLIHHALNAARGRTDAHGIAAGAVRALRVRDTEIHTFSGDGVQVDPGRAAPGWTDVTLERLRIWLAPLPAAENGFAAGAVTGENAVDTKASPAFGRSALTIRDVTAWGFRDGLLTNMAAFNLKEHVRVTVDRVTVFNSEIAFRLRGSGRDPSGGAVVTVSNAVVYSVGTAFRYEDRIRGLRLSHVTIGDRVDRPFRGANADAGEVLVRNSLIVGPRPREFDDASNLSVSRSGFADPGRGDYRLVPGSAAIDKAASTDVKTDRAGTPRPAGRAPDAGAFELTVTP